MTENISVDDLSKCGSPFKIFQDKSKFRFGIDAVLLADFAKKIRGDKICDLCTGNGIIPILLAGKTNIQAIHGLELQTDVANLANESIRMNGLEGRIKIYSGNLLHASSILKKNSYDAVTANPPYMKTNAQTEINSKSIARQEIFCTLEDVIKSASELLKSNGKFFLIHRPSRLSEIFIQLEKFNFGANRMRLIQPRKNEKATMVLIEAQKCCRPELIVEPALTIYSGDGKYTKETDEIYGRKSIRQVN